MEKKLKNRKIPKKLKKLKRPNVKQKSKKNFKNQNFEKSPAKQGGFTYSNLWTLFSVFNDFFSNHSGCAMIPKINESTKLE